MLDSDCKYVSSVYITKVYLCLFPKKWLDYYYILGHLQELIDSEAWLCWKFCKFFPWKF